MPVSAGVDVAESAASTSWRPAFVESFAGTRTGQGATRWSPSRWTTFEYERGDGRLQLNGRVAQPIRWLERGDRRSASRCQRPAQRHRTLSSPRAERPDACRLMDRDRRSCRRAGEFADRPGGPARKPRGTPCKTLSVAEAPSWVSYAALGVSGYAAAVATLLGLRSQRQTAVSTSFEN